MPPSVRKVYTGPHGGRPHSRRLLHRQRPRTGSPALWTTMYQYEEMVKFINEAHRVGERPLLPLLVLLGRADKLGLRPPDRAPRLDAPGVPPGRQRPGRPPGAQGLRGRHGCPSSSSATFGRRCRRTIPYMTIAQEIQAYDDTNYPGHPAGEPRRDPRRAGRHAAAAAAMPP